MFILRRLKLSPVLIIQDGKVLFIMMILRFVIRFHLMFILNLFWYKGKFQTKAKEISISARHIFAIYINGRELLNRNSYKYDNLCQVDEHLSVLIRPELLTAKMNEITVLVQNLGLTEVLQTI